MLFTPVKIGPITLRNRAIRAAAFEAMCQNHRVTPQLINYHEEVAKGGVGMTTIAYAAAQRSGLSFPHQLLIEESISPDLTKLVDKVDGHNAKASIQLSDCGIKAKKNIVGSRPISASTHINLYTPSYARKVKDKDIHKTIKTFGNSVRLVKKVGFNALENQAGHGYLISQFLSPYIYKRRDKYGFSLEIRMRFFECIQNK